MTQPSIMDVTNDNTRVGTLIVATTVFIYN